MNGTLQNPFAHDTPDSVDSVLAYAAATCCRYNKGHWNLVFSGQLVATGRTDGVVAIWDAETKRIVRWLVGHTKTVLGVAWSPNNRFLASCSYDCSIIIWDLSQGSGTQFRNIKFDTAVLSVQYDPKNSNHLLAVLETQEAVWIDLQQRIQVTRRRIKGKHQTNANAQNGNHNSNGQVIQQEGANKSGSDQPWDTPEFSPLPVRRWTFGGDYDTPVAPYLQPPPSPSSPSVSAEAVAGDADMGSAKEERSDNIPPPPTRRKGHIPQKISCAIFGHDGRHIFAGTSRGGLLVYDLCSRQLVQCEGGGASGMGNASASPAAAAGLLGPALIKEMAIDATGKMLLVNSNDRAIRAFSISINNEPPPEPSQQHRSHGAESPNTWSSMPSVSPAPEALVHVAAAVAATAVTVAAPTSLQAVDEDAQVISVSQGGNDLSHAERSAQAIAAVLEAAQEDADVDQPAALAATAASTNPSCSPSASAPPQPRVNKPFNVRLLYKVQDRVNRTPWCGIGFTGDGEYVFGGATNITAHNIYIWERMTGTLNRILEGPKEPLIGLDWHPHRPAAASVSSTGNVNLWSTPTAEIWSAYAPGFEELEENAEYEEHEDEFDVEDEDEVSRRKQDEEEGLVDIYPAGELIKLAKRHVRERARRAECKAGHKVRHGPRRLQSHVGPRGDGAALNNSISFEYELREQHSDDDDEDDSFWDGIGAFDGEGTFEVECRSVFQRILRRRGSSSSRTARAGASIQKAQQRYLQPGKRVRDGNATDTDGDASMHQVDSADEEDLEEVEQEEQVRIVLVEDPDDDHAFKLSARLEDPLIELNSDSD
ncbi:WD40 repeat-like protein [Tilletiaria anomala UBC 951]|uniref:WD40 repeat-like protein n=1 Tax=Tilletiaria anomala (strain ATCC 24038 / CBS 436.72 / UBC 951) TaxID=1037660 RepID=A0A066WQ41_TILAU|nr:WD40 repeat-like protein [Tilletiaria anomala UBC 951]KDN53124.1 WD40 repeat-like protein [Tilletiaria anomala UBC 951]